MQNYTAARHNIEAWYILMVILGAFNVAFNIMLIPQVIANNYTNGNVLIGIVMAAWTAGPLISPWISKLIRLTDGHQNNVAKLFLLNALLAFSIPHCSHIVSLFINLFLQGLIYASIYSILNLLIVKRFPEREWHARTSWLIAAFIIGELIGFAIAGMMTNPIRGISLGGVVLLATSIFCLQILPTYHTNDHVLSPQKNGSSAQAKDLLLSPFGLMILGWALLCFSAQILFLPFPVLMNEVFLLPPMQSSMTVSIAGLIALGFYPFIGHLTGKFGADSVLLGASFVKLSVFIIFTYCAMNMSHSLIPIVMLMIAINRWTWPFMMTSAQIQASTLSKGRGHTLALALFMAFSGAGNMLAGFANSYVTATLGIQYMPMFAAGSCLLGITFLLVGKFLSIELLTASLSPQGIINEKR